MPAIADRFFWSPPTVVLQSVGVLQAGAPLTGSVLVPSLPSFSGLPLVWHGLSLDPVLGAQVSAPGTFIVP